MRNLLLLLISTTAHAQQTGSCLEPRSRLAQANAELDRLETQLSRILREIRDAKQTVAQMNVSLAACEERQGTGASPLESAARRAGVAGADVARVHTAGGALSSAAAPAPSKVQIGRPHPLTRRTSAFDTYSTSCWAANSTTTSACNCFNASENPALGSNPTIRIWSPSADWVAGAIDAFMLKFVIEEKMGACSHHTH